MVVVKVLKRKDAASVIVAVVVALIVLQLLGTVTPHWAGWISGLDKGQYASSTVPGTGWKGEYLYPSVLAAVQLLALEVLGWIYIWASAVFKQK